MSTRRSDISSTLAYLVARFWCRLTRVFRPRPPAKPDYRAIYTASLRYDPPRSYGECNKGTYIEVYEPDKPCPGDNNKPKVVIFLHGFALGASQIYRAHLMHLVRQGYYVFYPNFQTGFCTFPPRFWRTVAELAREVLGDGLIHSQEKWLKAALKSVRGAFETVGFSDSTALDTYLYGHSLGGLFALSWPYYVKQEGYPDNMLPRQVVVADPVPNTAAGSVPGPLGDLFKQLTDDVDIQVTGSALTMPVAILHGNDDWVAPKDEWKLPFTYIATSHKKMFLAFTDRHGCPGLYANHEQATVDTSFFPVLLALLVLDGVGVEDTLDWRYLWHALDQVIRFEVRADQLAFDMGSWSDGVKVTPVEIFLSGGVS